jgi:protein SCO1/2
MNKRILLLVLLVLFAIVLSACKNDDEKPPVEEDQDQSDDVALFANTPESAHFTLDFMLDSTTGEAFTFSQAPDRVSIYYFGYLNCPDICPTTMAQLRQAYLALDEPADKLTVYFITVDPERDSLDNVRQFVALWSEDFVGLRGDEDALEPALDAFDVIAIRRDVADSAVGYLMDHSGQVYVVNRDGDLIAEFVHGVTASTLEHDLRIILDQEF